MSDFVRRVSHAFYDDLNGQSMVVFTDEDGDTCTVPLLIETPDWVTTLLGGDTEEAELSARVRFNPSETVKLNLSEGDVDPGDQDVPQGDGQSDSDAQDQRDGDGQDYGDGESDDDADESDGDGDGQQDSESDDQSDDEFKVPFPQSGEGEFEQEADSLDNEMLDDLWAVFRPRAVEIAENRAEYAARYLRRLGVGSGGGSGKVTVRVSGRKTGEIPAVRHFMFDTVLRAVARGCHVYLPGEPGTGKSKMAHDISKALGRKFHVMSFSPMSTESKLMGFRTATGETVHTGYRDGYIDGDVVLLDELDNANPAIIAGLNSGLANGLQEFPDGTFEVHPDFVCIATANTFGTGPTAEFAGRQKLDPATLNRFVKFYIGTDEALETQLVEAVIGSNEADRLLSKIRHYRRAVQDLRIKTFVTMRDSLACAKLCAKGDGAFTIPEAIEATVLCILTEDQVDKVRNWRG